jgi:hypothetical protein
MALQTHRESHYFPERITMIRIISLFILIAAIFYVAYN